MRILLSLRMPLLLALAAANIATARQSAQPVFSVAISVPQDVVASGAEVKVKIVLKNTSDHEIGVARSSREDQGEFHNKIVLRDEHGNLVQMKERGNNGGKGQNDTDSVIQETMVVFPLKPGELLKDGFIVSKAYDMSKPGKYSIQVERIDDESKTVVKSNTITVTVTP